MRNAAFYLLTEPEKSSKFRAILNEKTERTLTGEEMRSILLCVSPHRQYSIKVHSDADRFREVLQLSNGFRGKTVLGQVLVSHDNREQHQSAANALKIVEVKENKKQYLDLLLLADEQENMIDRYLTNGTMYVLEDGGVKAECVVLDVGGGVLEINNIATDPQFHGKGYGKALIEFITQKYKSDYSILQVGTGDSPSTIPFYEKCGFSRSHIIKNFFADHYDHPIYDDGVKLIDMIYLRKNI